MIDIGIGISTEKSEMAATEEAIRIAKSCKTNKENIDIVFAFATNEYGHAAVLHNINTFVPETPVLGAGATAFFSRNGSFKRGIMIGLLTLPEGVHFNTANITNVRGLESKTSLGEEMGEKLLYGFKNVPRSLSLLFFDQLVEDSTFVNGIQERLGKSFPCVGMSFCEASLKKRSHIFYDTSVITNGCTGVLFGGKIDFGFGIKHGWKPLGKSHYITGANANIITSIDNKPAVELYLEYIGYDETKLHRESRNISRLYPIGVKIPGQQEYLLRTVQSINRDGSLTCLGQVQTGNEIRFMISTPETCIQATKDAIEEARMGLSLQAGRHRENTRMFAIVFSSYSRAELLRRNEQQEIETIKQVLDPSTQILGIYTHGAIAPLSSTTYRGQSYFQNQIITVLLIEG